MLLSDNVTEWLLKWSSGDDSALETLTQLVYAELHRLAAGYLRRERQDHTLQPTALVHEAYLQIHKLENIEWKNRAHFIGIAARTMRRVLVDHARRHMSQKRGGQEVRSWVDANIEHPVSAPDLNVVALDAALEQFAREYPRQARVVELRFFGGLTSEETAEVLQDGDVSVSSRTVERDWRFARAWLNKALAGA